MSDDLDVLRLLEVLAARSVRYVLIGGVAMVLHGSAHVTQDVDIFYARDPDNLTALADALAELHPRLRGVPEDVPFRWDARTLAAGSNFTLETDAGAVDVLGSAAGVDSFEELASRAATVEVGELRVLVASLEDLIGMKQAANRPKDRAHLLELEALRSLPDHL